MSTKMLLTTRLDQRLVMNQQLRQAITLLQYNTIDLKQLIKQYIETNPLIEVDEVDTEAALDSDENFSTLAEVDHESLQFTRYSAEESRRNQYQKDDSVLENYAIPKSLRDHLLEQTWLCKFNSVDQKIAEAIIDAIDDNGHLTMSIDDIQQVLSDNISADHIADIINKIKLFDPIGVGARDIRECLLIQLSAVQTKDKTWQTATELLSMHIDMIAQANYKKITKKMGITQKEYTDAMHLIRSLNPYPGLAFSQPANINIEPELYVKKVKNTWCVYLADSVLTQVRLNTHYQQLIKQCKNDASYEVMNKELQEAQWLLKGLKRRNETLLKVATHVVMLQQAFFEHGHSQMKPLINADIAQALNLHESTISRVTTGKYISTPFGVYELKYFFPSHVSTKYGDNCSDTAVKALIKEILSQESMDKVLSDEDISMILKEKGVNIARRTVAKYREAMKILPSYQRNRMQIDSE